MNDNAKEFFIECLEKSMQNLTNLWEDNKSSTEELKVAFILAAGIFCLCEKFSFLHPAQDHAGMLLNQIAVQLGLEEKF